jgi:hypothetical protein
LNVGHNTESRLGVGDAFMTIGAEAGNLGNLQLEQDCLKTARKIGGLVFDDLCKVGFVENPEAQMRHDNYLDRAAILKGK